MIDPDAIKAAKCLLEHTPEGRGHILYSADTGMIARALLEAAEALLAEEQRIAVLKGMVEGTRIRAEIAEAQRDALLAALREMVAYNNVESHLNGCTDTVDGSLECICDDPYPGAQAAIAQAEKGAT